MNYLLMKIKNFVKGEQTMFINYFAIQINLGWLTIEQVPKKYRKKVQALIDAAGSEETEHKEE